MLYQPSPRLYYFIRCVYSFLNLNFDCTIILLKKSMHLHSNTTVFNKFSFTDFVYKKTLCSQCGSVGNTELLKQRVLSSTLRPYCQMRDEVTISRGLWHCTGPFQTQKKKQSTQLPTSLMLILKIKRIYIYYIKGHLQFTELIFS